MAHLMKREVLKALELERAIQQKLAVERPPHATEGDPRCQAHEVSRRRIVALEQVYTEARDWPEEIGAGEY